MRFVLISLTLAASCTLWAQGSKVSRSHIEEMPVLENSRFECIYNHYDYDAGLERGNERDEILQLGRKYLVYAPYGTYRTDSVVQLMDKKARDEMSYVYYNNNIAVKYNWGGSDRMQLDLKTKRLWEVSPAGSMFRFQEQMPVQDWELLPGEIEILGYKCKKARCDFRGRSWTVWYCPEIKVSYGPWKLNGLPGLILKADDKTGAHSFVAVGLRTKPTIMYTTSCFDEVKEVDRKEFYKIRKEYCYSFCTGMWKAYYEDPVNNTKPAVKRLWFVPLELDFED